MGERTNNKPLHQPATTIRMPRATRTRPGLGVPSVAPTQTELEARIKARRTELVERMVRLKRDSHVNAQHEREELAAKISEVGHLIKELGAGGWSNVSERAKQELEDWLVRTHGEPESWSS